MRPERLGEMFVRELVDERQQVRDRMHLLRGGAERSRHVAVERIGVQHDAIQTAPDDGRGEVGGHERRAGSPARTVHGDDPGTPILRSTREHRGRRGAREGVAVGGPEVEAVRACLDGGTQRRHGLPRVERQEGGPAYLRPVHEGGLGDDGVGFKLADGGGELTIVLRRGHDAGGTAAVQEVHHLLDDIWRLERQDHACDLFHAAPSRRFAGEARPDRETVRGGTGSRP